jgi:hypothetical protein
VKKRLHFVDRRGIKEKERRAREVRKKPIIIAHATTASNII